METTCSYKHGNFIKINRVTVLLEMTMTENLQTAWI